MPDLDAVPIASLRWPVLIIQRTQAVSGTASIAESFDGGVAVMADVQPIGAMTFLAGQQTDRPITHRITVRWLDWLDETYVIVRDTIRTDDTVRREIFRIRRIMEKGGRKRFLSIECELESRE